MKNNIILSLTFLMFAFMPFGLSAKNQEATSQLEQNFEQELKDGFVENITSKSAIEGFTASWNLDYELFEELKEEGFTISIQYNTKIGAKRHEKGYDNSDWTVVEELIYIKQVTPLLI